MISTLRRADTSGERTADNVFLQKCTQISKFTSISGQNEKINIDKTENSETVSKKRIFSTVIGRVRMFPRIFNDIDYFSCYYKRGRNWYSIGPVGM